MRDKFLIGELARVFNISTDTLRHYDKMNILKPEYDKKNEYRYYNLRSLFKLSRVLFFKSLDISLTEIRGYMKNKNRKNLLDLLKSKDEEIEKKINRLNSLKKKIKDKVELLESVETTLGIVRIKRIQKRAGIFLDINNLKSEIEVKQEFKNVGNYLRISSWSIEGQIYTSLSKEDMLNGVFNKYRYFIEINTADLERNLQLKAIEENDYVCMTFIGPYTEMPLHYKVIVEWIKDNNYEIIGDSIEKNIVDYDFSDSENEYISEIQVPVNRVK